MDLGLPSQIAHDSEAYISKLHTMALNNPVRIGALEAYTHGFQAVWIFMTATAATGLLASVFIKKFSLDKILMSNYSARPESS